MRQRLLTPLLLAGCAAEPSPPNEGGAGTDTSVADGSGTDAGSGTGDADTTADATAGDATMGMDATDDTGDTSADATDDTTGVGPECTGPTDCGGTTPFCDPDGTCVACDGMPDPDGACTDADDTLPVCEAGECVQCTEASAAACGGQTPICATDNTCVACVEHFECPDSACHLDGPDVGACFDEADVVMAANAGSLATVLSGVSSGDDVVVVLAGGTDYNQTVNITEDVEVALLGPSSAELTGTTGLPSLNVAGSAIVYIAGPSIASGDTGVACSGTSVWLDDSEVRNNAQAGLDISGGCAAHLRRTVVRANDSGGIVSSGSTVYLENSAVGENIDTMDVAGIRVTNGEFYATYSSIVANLAVMDPANNMQCFGSPTGEVRNSIVVASGGNSISGCGGLDWSNNAVDTAGLGVSNDNTGYMASWFNATEGDFHLTGTGATTFADIAQWEDGDPLTDFDGDGIPTAMPSHPGYDQP